MLHFDRQKESAVVLGVISKSFLIKVRSRKKDVKAQCVKSTRLSNTVDEMEYASLHESILYFGMFENYQINQNKRSYIEY